MSTSPVWVLDASSIIHIKTAVPGKPQWRLFKKLEHFVENGQIAFPKQVAREVSELAHPDGPGIWVDGVLELIKYPMEPRYEVLREVMATAGRVVDPSKQRDDGDPYLLAMALQLARDGADVCIVSEDTTDRPARIAVSSACKLLSLQWCQLSEFLEWVERRA